MLISVEHENILSSAEHKKAFLPGAGSWHRMHTSKKPNMP